MNKEAEPKRAVLDAAGNCPDGVDCKTVGPLLNTFGGSGFHGFLQRAFY
jgi:hypothetical protein